MAEVEASPTKRRIVDELHRAARRNYPRRSVIVCGIDDSWQADLIEMIPHAAVNKGYKYLLTVIDNFSKYAWARALKSKKAGDVSHAFEDILNTSGRRPKNLQTDDGKEFFNRTFASLVKRFRINHYKTFSTKKASIVERFNRTLKGHMYKTFSVNGNYKWADMLSGLMQRYNTAVHRTIGMRPVDVNSGNESEILERIGYERAAPPHPPPKFKVGDHVRVSKIKSVFAKGYTPNWSTEIFTVATVRRTSPPTYLLRDFQGQDIAGGFYGEELQKTRFKDVYLVEKILQRKGNKSYVKWLGFDNSHNSWIDNSDID